MMFTNKSLAAISTMSERTFFRRLKAIKEQGLFTSHVAGGLLSLEEARKIASHLHLEKNTAINRVT